MSKTEQIYKEVTAALLEEMDNAKGVWNRPWTTAGLARNAVSRKKYRGGNQFLLTLAALRRNYSSPFWMTFKQAKALGGHVKKGEKGVGILYCARKSIDGGDDADNEEENEERSYFMVRAYRVFNLEQTTVDPADFAICQGSEPERKARAERIIRNSGASIHYGGDEACYIPALDMIRMPPRSAFDEASGLYATAFHELGHWTGHESRLNRTFGRMGSKQYAYEELVAEFTSAFFCAETGIEGKLQHAEYLNGYRELLESDSRAVLRAASDAQKAADLILACENGGEGDRPANQADGESRKAA